MLANLTGIQVDPHAIIIETISNRMMTWESPCTDVVLELSLESLEEVFKLHAKNFDTQFSPHNHP